jgi:elongation factor P
MFRLSFRSVLAGTAVRSPALNAFNTCRAVSTLASKTHIPAIRASAAPASVTVSSVTKASASLIASIGASAEYKVNCGDVKTGYIVEIDGKLYQVMGLQISQAAMRKSSMSLDIKDLKTGSKSPFRCKPSDKIERTSPPSVRSAAVRVARFAPVLVLYRVYVYVWLCAGVELERKTYTYLYRTGDILYLMDPNTFEQIEVDASILTDAREAAYLQENRPISVEYHGDKILRIIMPTHAIVQVKLADLSGGSGLKVAELMNGRLVRVSQATQCGDWIKLQISDESFVDRVPPPTDA